MAKRTTAPKAVEAPKPPSAAFMRGREAAAKFTSEMGHDELADGLLGFREGVNAHIKDNQAKLDAVAEHLNRAEEAINP